jgi:hypothetical protein
VVHPRKRAFPIHSIPTLAGKPSDRARPENLIAPIGLARLTDPLCRRFFPLWSEWSGMAPDGSPIFVRDLSTQGNLCARIEVNPSR